MLDVQQAKIALEMKQAEIALWELDHNQRIADKSIQAQAEDLRDERDAEKTMHRHRLIFASAMAALLLSFVLAALWMDKDAMVLDVIKVVIGFIGGWGGSLAWQSRRSSRPQQD
ncbi:MAG: hypothetical protein WCK08_01195 [Betaproteobacteria bacterium]